VEIDGKVSFEEGKYEGEHEEREEDYDGEAGYPRGTC
jgi:hypothetical protein